MILSNVLSRQKHDERDPHEIMPISFNMQELLHNRYYNIHECEQKRYLIQTKTQAKTSGTILPKVHGVDNGVDPNVRPEKQIVKPLATPHSYVPIESIDQYNVKPRLGQGRASIKNEMLKFPILQPCDKS